VHGTRLVRCLPSSHDDSPGAAARVSSGAAGHRLPGSRRSAAPRSGAVVDLGGGGCREGRGLGRAPHVLRPDPPGGPGADGRSAAPPPGDARSGCPSAPAHTGAVVADGCRSMAVLGPDLAPGRIPPPARPASGRAGTAGARGVERGPGVHHHVRVGLGAAGAVRRDLFDYATQAPYYAMGGVVLLCAAPWVAGAVARARPESRSRCSVPAGLSSFSSVSSIWQRAART
jgi:hypothetical protein